MVDLCEFSLSHDIFAVYVYQKFLFVGEGSNILVFDVEETRCGSINSQKLFDTSAVHGIRIFFPINRPELEMLARNTIRIMVWGQKSFCCAVFNLQSLKWEFISQEFIVEDWIVSAAWLDNGDYIGLATAHNTLIQCFTSFLYHSQNVSQKFSKKLSPIPYPKDCIITRKQCSKNSLLYCGVITGEAWIGCVVLCGTAFGKIYIWAPWTLADDSGKFSPIMSLSGPKGAVFSITFDEVNKLISATSDDRCVRVWKVKASSANCTSSELPEYQHFWLNCEIHHIFCAYGHSARVWRSIILEDETVLSCGEDATICHWSESGCLKDAWIAHPSSNVWCLAYARDSVFSGGGDGAIKRWKFHNRKNFTWARPCIPWSSKSDKNVKELNKVHNSDDSKHNRILVNHANSKSYKGESKKNFPRSINLIDDKTAVVICDNGQLWVYEEQENLWKFVFEHPFLKGYIVPTINQNSTFFALGTLNGHIFLLRIETWECICQCAIGLHKIQALMFIDSDIIISCTGEGLIQLWKINKDANVCLQLMRKHVLPSCRQRWATAAALVFQSSQENLIVGDPCGNVHLFIQQNEEPVHSLKGIHGRNGVTSLKVYENGLISTGRDGFIRFLDVKDRHLIVVFDWKLTVGSWITGVIKNGLDVITLVFNDEKLQFWNVAEDQMLSEIECGGGHRSWDLILNSQRFSPCGVLTDSSSGGNNMRLTCAFLKNGSPVLWELNLEEKFSSTMKSGTSGREIQCMELIIAVSGLVLFTFGGEDTLLHMQILQEGNLHNVCGIKSHLSSIRSITRIQSLVKEEEMENIYLLSSGGRAQMKVWNVSLSKGGKDIFLEGTFDKSPKEGDSIMLSDVLNRIVYCKEIASHKLNNEFARSWKSRGLTYDPETRYMDSLAFWIEANTAVFFLASSDGFMRFFKFKNSKFTLVCSQDCKFCLLRLAFVKLKEGFFVIGSTTRGNIIIWSFEFILEKINSFPEDGDLVPETSLESLHYSVQSCGLNSLAAIETESVGSETLLATGGDDGSVHLLKISSVCSKWEKSKDIVSIQTCSTVCSHSAQVSGLVWVDENHLCSASADQRLILWKLENLSLVPLKVYFCSVPDIQGIRVFKESLPLPFRQKAKECFQKAQLDQRNILAKLFVFGKGIEIFYVIK